MNLLQGHFYCLLDLICVVYKTLCSEKIILLHLASGVKLRFFIFFMCLARYQAFLVVVLVEDINEIAVSCSYVDVGVHETSLRSLILYI